MGRRALRKLDPTIDLAGTLFTFEQLPNPWQSTALFPREAPLEIEVGSGKGLFLASAGAAQPETNFLGMEVAKKYAEHAAERVLKRGLNENVRVLSGDALRVFRELLPDNSLAAVHVYFPDPWWKARHRKRRVMNEVFARDIERTLVPGGALHFWSDVEEYFLTTLELLAAQTRLTGPLPVPERVAEHDLDYRTHFERRMRKHGQPVYRAEYRKQADR
jgi:tRNA (guanine-N7-)-methyltransferase